MVGFERMTPASDLMPQTALLTAVVLEAIRDARRGDEEAWKFLTAKRGGWREARETYAALLGFDAEILRENVLRGIARNGKSKTGHLRR